MSTVPPGSDLAALLEQLRKLPSGTTSEQAAELLRPRQAEPLETARERAALVRIFDDGIFSVLTADIESRPSSSDLLTAFPHDFESIPPYGWQMRVPVRDPLLARWQGREAEWRTWNSRLFEEFRTRAHRSDGRRDRADRRDEVEAVYHGAAGRSEPSAPASGQPAIGYFQERYAEADDRADFAHCHALLEAVRTQERFRGPAFSQVYRDRARYLQSRLLFLDALQKSGSYLRRTAPHRAFDAVRATTQPWIFHIHATGGLGKSMFVRWSIARDLVRKRIPCAYVDFDEHRLLTFVQHPLQLIGLVMTQWAQQMTHTVFTSAVALLRQNEGKEGWDPATLETLRTTLQGANVQDEMIAVLDTLEEATLFEPAWLKKCIATLAELHAYLPRLTLVLAGRYDLTRIAGLLDPADVVAFEMPPFRRGEAEEYLTLRRISDAALRGAIIERAAIDGAAPSPAGPADASEGQPAAPPEEEEAINPFKLALIVELVQGSDGLTADEVRRLPNVDIAYLIERVILRIPSQPLRWMIRYGAIARRLSKSFLNEVLLPPLQAALRGETTDLNGTHLSDEVRRYLDSKVTWTPQPELAVSLNASTLWSDLAAYARERGWITLDARNDVLVLHPEVVRPVQMLLSSEPIYRTLHTAAREFHLARWGQRSSLPAGTGARGALEAIYHATALDPVAARDLWRRLLQEAGDAAAVIAKEPTTPTYVDEENRPRHPEWFAEAHVACARLDLEAAGLLSTATVRRSFAAHVAAARRTNPASVPRLFDLLASVADQADSDAQKAERLERAATELEQPTDRFWVHVWTARYWTAAGDPAAAQTHWGEAAQLLTPMDAPHWLSEIDRNIGDLLAADPADRYRQAMAAYSRAGRLVRRVDLIEQQASLAMQHRDMASAGPLLESLEPSSKAATLLNLHRLVQSGDAEAVLAAGAPRADGHGVRTVGSISRVDEGSPEQAAEHYLLEGLAHRRLLDFAAALESFSRATDIAGAGSGETAFAPSRVAELELYAFDMGDLATAHHLLERFPEPRAPLSTGAAAVLTVAAVIAAGDRRHDRAAEFVRTLRTHPSLVVRCRALLLAAAFQLDGSAEEQLEVFDRSVADLDPPERLADILDLVEYLPPIAASSAATRHAAAIVDMAGRVRRERKSPPFELPLQAVELARFAALPPTILQSVLRTATSALPKPPTAGRAWYGLRLVELHEGSGEKPPFSYATLLKEAATMGVAGTPLEALIMSRASMEIANADPGRARAMADKAVEVWEKQPANRFSTEVSRARTDLLDGMRERTVFVSLGLESAPPAAAEAPVPPPFPAPSPPPVAAPSPARRSPAPPPAPRAPDAESAGVPRGPVPLVRIAIEGEAAKRLDALFPRQEVDAIADALFKDWRRVRSGLADVIAQQSHGADLQWVQIVTSLRDAALPWELLAGSLGSEVFCRGIRGRYPDPPPATQPGPRSILLIKAESEAGYDGMVFEGSGFDVSESASSGFSLDRLYADSFDREDLLTLAAPHPDELHKVLKSFRPAVIHIVGQVFESTSGVYIDFEGAERRAFRRTEKQSFSSSIDSRRLVRYLSDRRPVVVLDLTAPENVVDLIRMLLLRNKFAGELFQSGAVRAVFATGLAAPWTRETSARRLVSSVRDNAPLAFLRNLPAAEAPEDLGQPLGGDRSALFADDPLARLFGDTGPAKG